MAKKSVSVISMCISLMSDRLDEYTLAETIDAFCKENIPNITISKINDIKIAISAAFCNIRDHAYTDGSIGMVDLICNYKNDNTFIVTVIDNGCGIKNLDEAIQPMWSSKEGFAGMGFSVMDSMCDKFEVSTTNPDKGTTVVMTFDIK